MEIINKLSRYITYNVELTDIESDSDEISILSPNLFYYIYDGIKYFISSKRWFFSPMIKFNPETTSIGVGISYN